MPCFKRDLTEEYKVVFLVTVLVKLTLEFKVATDVNQCQNFSNHLTFGHFLMGHTQQYCTKAPAKVETQI